MISARLALFASAAIAAVSFPGAVAAQDITPPDVLVKTVTLEVVDIIRKDKELQNDRKKVVALIETKVVPHFNFTSMTASAVGSAWPKATPEQKTRLTDEFRTLMVRTYASSIAAYKDQKFDFRPLRAKPTDTDVTVQVRVLQQGAEPVKLDYDMEKTARGWKVWDVRIADISLTANYRTEFANIMRSSGIDGLVTALHNKNAGLDRAQPAASADKKK